MPNADVYIPEDQRTRKRKRFYFVIVVVIVYLVFLAGSWLILWTPLFRIQRIDVVGNETVTREEIVSLLSARVVDEGPFSSLFGLKSFLTWPSKLSGEDLVPLPTIKSLEIEKNYRDRSVLVTVVEREPYGIWCRTPSPETLESVRCWWFDNEGMIFKKALLAQGSLITAVVDYSQEDLGLRAKILPQELIPHAFSIFNVLKKSELGIKEVRLEDISLEELVVSTHEGPKLYFSLRFPADNNLAVIENFTAKPGFGKLEYLDFRVENRVYYK